MPKTQQTEKFNKVCVIGLGLIGGSLARALREHDLCNELVGHSRSAATMEKALSIGLVDRVEADPAKAVAECDLVFIAIPVSYTEACLNDIKSGLSDRVIITDGGSVKAEVVKAVTNSLGDAYPRFVAGHPIAGSEQSGVESGRADLFVDHKVILTPSDYTDAECVKRIANMWKRVGAEVLEMGVGQHDRVLAATSHLPHLLAYALVDSLSMQDDSNDIFRYAAGGFRDFTRIASSDPRMWTDILLANKEQTVAALDRYQQTLTHLRQAILEDDDETLLGSFTRSKSARDHFVAILNKKSYTDSMSNTTHSEVDISYAVTPASQVKGELSVPGDKSISHRSIMLSSLAEGTSTIRGFLEGEDSLATLQAFRDMGVVIEGPENGEVVVHGVGLNGLQKPPGPLYLGNSGTSMRLLMGLLSGQSFDCVLTGDESLSVRPMERVAKPLRMMGAQIETGDDGTAPVKITGVKNLNGMGYHLEVVSAQVKSAILLAGLYTQDSLSVTELDVTRDHSERMLNGFGVRIEQAGLSASMLAGPRTLKAQDIHVPGDISSAAFFLVAASIAKGSELTIQHVGINPSRIGVIAILKLMGADISLGNERTVGGEPVADICVKYAPLKGIVIPEDLVSLAIDEFPVLFIAAACAEGKTVLTNAEELRVKETDRIAVMADGLAVLGVSHKVLPDGIEIDGCTDDKVFSGGTVNSGGDHRIAMAFSVASLRAAGDIAVLDCANVATSFPGFVELANSVGLAVKAS